MNIQTFVNETLTQICEGVAAASENVSDTGAIICPAGIISAGDNMYVHEDYRRIVQNVEFDVAVAVTAEAGRDGALGLTVGPSETGSTIKAESENPSTRIRFTVPVALPPTAASLKVEESSAQHTPRRQLRPVSI